MKGSTSQNSRCFSTRPLMVALVSVAMASAIALLSFGMAKPAMAADDASGLSAGTIETQSSSTTKATKASAFKYEAGLYLDEHGVVQQSKCWYGTKTIDGATYKRTKGYDVEYHCSIIKGGSGGGGQGYNCGSGIYITGYKGPANADVVIPNKIGGKPVVCVSLDNVKLKSLDVSKCQSLRALSLGKPAAGGTACTIGEIKFGKNAKLTHFSFDMFSTVTKKLEITPANIRSLRLYFSNTIGGFSFDTKKLRVLHLLGVSGLRLGDNKYLKELSIDGKNPQFNPKTMPQLVTLSLTGCGLNTLDVSKNKKLKTIYAKGNNFNKKTVAALKKWQKAKKGRKLVM